MEFLRSLFALAFDLWIMVGVKFTLETFSINDCCDGDDNDEHEDPALTRKSVSVKGSIRTLSGSGGHYPISCIDSRNSAVSR